MARETRSPTNGSGFTLNDVTTRSGSFFEGPRLAVFSLYQGRESRKGLDGRAGQLLRLRAQTQAHRREGGNICTRPGGRERVVRGRNGRKQLHRPAAGRGRSRGVGRGARSPAPRPATFCGGIGNYRLAASASPTALRVGDPLTLTLDIERGQGSGSLDLISAPDLAANPQLAADFEILDKNPTGRKEGEMKRFEYALRPKRAGVGIPSAGRHGLQSRYRKVLGDRDQADCPRRIGGQSPGRGGACRVASGFRDTGDQVAGAGDFSKRDRSVGTAAIERVNVVALAEVAAGSWCGVGCLIAVVSAHRRKSGDVVWQRKRHARRTAERKLAEARKVLAAGRSMDALRAIRSALVGLIADMRNIVAEGLTASEVDATLAQTAVPAAERAEVLRLLEAIESAEYGSGIASEATAMIETAEGLIPSLARHLERGVVSDAQDVVSGR